MAFLEWTLRHEHEHTSASGFEEARASRSSRGQRNGASGSEAVARQSPPASLALPAEKRVSIRNLLEAKGLCPACTKRHCKQQGCRLQHMDAREMQEALQASQGVAAMLDPDSRYKDEELIAM
eukprot:scaffold112880_cov41-Prasinocladus_malaysianus.AAC.1